MNDRTSSPADQDSAGDDKDEDDKGSRHIVEEIVRKRISAAVSVSRSTKILDGPGAVGSRGNDFDGDDAALSPRRPKGSGGGDCGQNEIEEQEGGDESGRAGPGAVHVRAGESVRRPSLLTRVLPSLQRRSPQPVPSDDDREELSVEDGARSEGGGETVDGQRLVTAVRVDPDDDDDGGGVSPDGTLPMAVSYDPSKENPGDSLERARRRQRRKGALAMLAMVVAIGAAGTAVGLTVGRNANGRGGSPPNEHTTALPEAAAGRTITHREALLIDLLTRNGILESSEIELSDSSESSSPHTKAVAWLANEDPMQLDLLPTGDDGNDESNTTTTTLVDPSVVQRYIAAYLYFSLTELRPWRTCNPPVQDDPPLCWLDVVASVQVDPPEYTSIQAVRWLTSTSECDWAGLKCDDLGRVVSIDLGTLRLDAFTVFIVSPRIAEY